MERSDALLAHPHHVLLDGLVLAHLDARRRSLRPRSRPRCPVHVRLATPSLRRSTDRLFLLIFPPMSSNTPSDTDNPEELVLVPSADGGIFVDEARLPTDADAATTTTTTTQPSSEASGGSFFAALREMCPESSTLVAAMDVCDAQATAYFEATRTTTSSSTTELTWDDVMALLVYGRCLTDAALAAGLGAGRGARFLARVAAAAAKLPRVRGTYYRGLGPAPDARTVPHTGCRVRWPHAVPVVADYMAAHAAYRAHAFAQLLVLDDAPARRLPPALARALPVPYALLDPGTTLIATDVSTRFQLATLAVCPSVPPVPKKRPSSTSSSLHKDTATDTETPAPPASKKRTTSSSSSSSSSNPPAETSSLLPKPRSPKSLLPQPLSPRSLFAPSLSLFDRAAGEDTVAAPPVVPPANPPATSSPAPAFLPLSPARPEEEEEDEGMKEEEEEEEEEEEKEIKKEEETSGMPLAHEELLITARSLRTLTARLGVSAPAATRLVETSFRGGALTARTGGAPDVFVFPLRVPGRAPVRGVVQRARQTSWAFNTLVEGPPSGAPYHGPHPAATADAIALPAALTRRVARRLGIAPDAVRARVLAAYAQACARHQVRACPGAYLDFPLDAARGLRVTLSPPHTLWQFLGIDE